MLWQKILVGMIGVLCLYLFANEITNSTSKLPKIECATTVELGEQEAGSIAIAEWVIRNSGGKKLHIHNVRSSCGCSTLEVLDGQTWIGFRELWIEPQESKLFQLRISVSKNPKELTKGVIYFDSNDPDSPINEVNFFVNKVVGIGFQPEVVTLGVAILDSEVSQEIDVINYGTSPIQMESVVSSDTSRFTAEILSDAKPNTEIPNSGTFIGKLKVRAITTAPVSLEGNVFVRLTKNGEQARELALPVKGLVTNPITISPSKLIFPRNSETGRVYTGTCLCRSRNQKPFDLQWINPKPDFLIKIVSNKETPETKVVLVEFLGKPDTVLESTLELEAIQNGQKHHLDLSVRIEK